MTNQGEKMMYIVYGKTKCPFCTNAVTLLQTRGISFTYYSMDERQGELLEMASQYKHRTVPIILQSENSEVVFIGGFDALKSHLNPEEQK